MVSTMVCVWDSISMLTVLPTPLPWNTVCRMVSGMSQTLNFPALVSPTVKQGRPDTRPGCFSIQGSSIWTKRLEMTPPPFTHSRGSSGSAASGGIHYMRDGVPGQGGGCCECVWIKCADIQRTRGRAATVCSGIQVHYQQTVRECVHGGSGGSGLQVHYEQTVRGRRASCQPPTVRLHPSTATNPFGKMYLLHLGSSSKTIVRLFSVSVCSQMVAWVCTCPLTRAWTHLPSPAYYRTNTPCFNAATGTGILQTAPTVTGYFVYSTGCGGLLRSFEG